MRIHGLSASGSPNGDGYGSFFLERSCIHMTVGVSAEVAEEDLFSSGFPPILLNTDRASDLLSVRREQLAKWRVEGKGPKFRRTGAKGSQIVYLYDDVVAWAKSLPVIGGAKLRITTKKPRFGAKSGFNPSFCAVKHS